MAAARAPQVAFRLSVMREPRTLDRGAAVREPEARRGAGEAVALEFVLVSLGVDGLEVMDPGVVRRVAVGVRIVQEGGVSLEQRDS